MTLRPSANRTLTYATWLWLLTAVAAVIGVAALILTEVLDGVSPFQLGDVIKGWDTAVLNPAYWVFVVLLICAERLWPAERNAGALTAGGAVDLMWLLLAPLFSLTIVAFYLTGLHWVLNTALNGWHVDAVGVIGVVPAAIAAFLIADFGMWLSHFTRHKVPLFWRFHAVHHSQKQMSVLTDNRVHFIEAIVTATIVYVPTRLVGLGEQASVALAFATVFFTGFTHANLRTNLGPLRWLLVTPQSHRIHHSNQPEHFDRNFGAILSIWDRIFHTAWHRADDYPTTGIDDARFPVEAGASPLTGIRYYAMQVAYPFAGVLRKPNK